MPSWTRWCRALVPTCELAREMVVTAGFDVGAERPAHPTIAQLREVTQPPSVRTRAAAEHWVAHAYLRDISLSDTDPAERRVQCQWRHLADDHRPAGAAVATGWPTLFGAILAVILVQLQMLLDCCDGEVALAANVIATLRVPRSGGHYVAECGIAVALGVRATGELRLSGIWISAGLLLGLLIALNKVENDLVHVARHYAGLPQMRDAEEVRTPRGGLLRTARRLAGLVPFHRVFHSVELSILVLIAAIIDLRCWCGDEGAARCTRRRSRRDTGWSSGRRAGIVRLR